VSHGSKLLSSKFSHIAAIAQRCRGKVEKQNRRRSSDGERGSKKIDRPRRRQLLHQFYRLGNNNSHAEFTFIYK
jgi:hypothetical protein